jgi:sulfur transfer complex TusBCD TusB component (DsrH family)
MGAFESGQQFLAGVLSKLPAEQQAQAKAIFEAAEAKDAVSLVGDGALARSDYSRSMDQLREKEVALTDYYTRLNTWYADNQTALDQARQLASDPRQAQLQPLQQQPQQPQPQQQYYLQPNQLQPQPQPQLPYDPAALAAAGNLSREEIRRIADDAVNEAGKDYIAVSAFLATQGARHSHLFGEPLDMNELIANPRLGRPIAGQPGRVYSLQDAYLERYGTRLMEKQKEAEDKRINDEVEKRLGDRIKQQTSVHPFPLRHESSPLDVLSTKDGPAVHTLDSAVAEYERLVSAKQG